MENRIDTMVDNVSKWIDLLFDNSPKDISYYICIYARDPKDIREDYPDWYTRIKSWWRSWYFDRAQIWQYIKEQMFVN